MGLLDGLFSKKTKEINEFSITPEDKRWVDNCYKWLLKTFGYPQKGSIPFLFNASYFPITFQAKKINVENLLSDLCKLYALEMTSISFELEPDIRDIANTPHQIYGKAFESDLEVIPYEDKSRFTIRIANSVQHNEFLLIRRLILELTKIKIYEKSPNLVAESSLTYFTYVAAVYFGFGVLISKALVEVGMQYRAGWQTKWKNKSEVPYQVVAYALASYSKLIGDEAPTWKRELPADVTEEYDSAVKYLTENPDVTTYFDPNAFENDLKARQHQINASSFSKEKKLNEALAEYNLAISLTTDKDQLAVIYVNAGYVLLMLEKYDESLVFYQKALDIQPEYPYSFANMGYIYVMQDHLEKAKECFEKVDAYNDSLKSYLLRDWALYYMKQGNDELTEDYFRKAFDTKMTIDLLEYFYAKYLLSKSNNDEAVRYAAISAEKGEWQGIELIKSLSK